MVVEICKKLPLTRAKSISPPASPSTTVSLNITPIGDARAKTTRKIMGHFDFLYWHNKTVIIAKAAGILCNTIAVNNGKVLDVAVSVGCPNSEPSNSECIDKPTYNEMAMPALCL